MLNGDIESIDLYFHWILNLDKRKVPLDILDEGLAVFLFISGDHQINCIANCAIIIFQSLSTGLNFHFKEFMKGLGGTSELFTLFLE